MLNWIVNAVLLFFKPLYMIKETNLSTNEAVAKIGADAMVLKCTDMAGHVETLSKRKCSPPLRFD